MDKYRKLMCVKGLIMSLDEQIYRFDQKDGLSQEEYQKVVEQYWDAIKEQLHGNDVEKSYIEMLYKNGIISHDDRLDLLAQLKKKDEPDKAKEDTDDKS